MSLPTQNRLVNPLAKARGLGSAHEGLHHWLMERITAALLVPLSFWVIWSLLSLLHADFARLQLWMSSPLNAVLLITFIVTSFYHGAMGLQVVLEDYISCHCTRLVSVIAVKTAFAVMGLASVFSILKLAL